MSEDEDDPFSQIEFPKGDSADEYINKNHDPDLLYNHIKSLFEQIENKIIEKDSEDSSDQIIYAKIDILRSTMQYAEEFGLYLASYIQEDRGMVDGLVNFDVSNLFEVYDDRAGDQLFPESVYEERLKDVFGYSEMEIEGAEERLDISGDNSLTDNEIQDLVSVSVNGVKAEIRSIALFYLEFRDLYNAIKHGTRVFPQDYVETTFSWMDEELIVDQPYIVAFCKKSSDYANGEMYLLHYPVDRMVSRSLYILERINRLFTYLRDIHRDKANREPKQRRAFYLSDDEAEGKQIPDFMIEQGTTVQDSETQKSESLNLADDYVEGWNDNAKFILPVSDNTENLIPDNLNRFSVRFKVSGSSLVVSTEFDEGVSEDYPISVSYDRDSSSGARLRIADLLNFNASFSDIDFKQQDNLIKIEDAIDNNGIDSVEIDIKHENESIKYTKIGNWNFNGGSPGFDKDIISFVARLQKITDQFIPIPGRILEDQMELLQSSMDSIEERDDALELLEEIRNIGDDVSETYVFIEKDERKQLISCFEDSLSFKCEMENGESFTIDGNETEVGQRPPIELRNIQGNAEEFMQHLEENPELVSNILAGQVMPNGESDDSYDLIIEYDIGCQTYWYEESEVVIRAEGVENS